MVALVLMAVLLLAFFSRALLNRQVSFSSTNLVRSEYLARTSLDFIIGELRQEIADPARSTNLTIGGVTLHQPLTNTFAGPQKTGVSGTDTNGAQTLAKVSSGGAALRTGGATASDSPITTPSQGGRLVSWNRWFGTGGPLLGTQPAVPAWFYLTRGGVGAPGPAAAGDRQGTNYVVGRFACTVYDVSGRLDANIAGYPAAAATNAAFKSGEACADLTRLGPGVAQVGEFVKWREGGRDLDATAFQASVDRAAARGNTTIEAGQNALLSRRDLLRGADAGVVPDTAQELTTFSRWAAGPTWKPAKDAAELGGDGGFDYASDAEDPGAVNRSVLSVRHGNNGAITRYRDNGEEETVAVAEGDPLLARRFSLAKLGWLTHQGPKAGISAEAIAQSFGLAWREGTADFSPHWEYTAAGSAPVRIKTLDEVAQEGREPNFFEILKAGILAGSTGRDPGGIAAANGEPTSDAVLTGEIVEGPMGHQFGEEEGNQGYSEDADRHIIQIGTNIIDQADADSIPTAVYFPAFAESAPAGKIYNTLFGNENLPYLARLFATTAEYPKGTLATWFRPEIWNPHQAPVARPGTPAPPTQFRIRCYGSAHTSWFMKGGGGGLPNAPGTVMRGDPMDYDGADRDAGIVYFSSAAGTASPFYNNPVLLAKSHTDTVKTPETNFYDGKNRNPVYPDNRGVTGDRVEFAGAWVGGTPAPGPAEPWNTIPDGAPNPYRLYLNATGDNFTMSLECWDGQHWRPYSFMSRLGVGILSGSGMGAPGSNPDGSDREKGPLIPPALYFGRTGGMHDGNQDWRNFVRADPRTDRFSAGWTRSNAGNVAGTTKFVAYQTMEPGQGAESLVGRAFIVEKYAPREERGFKNLPASFHAFQSLMPAWARNRPATGEEWEAAGFPPGAYSYYADPDGVARPGDGFHRDAGKGNGCMLYHATNKTGSAVARRPVILNRPFRSVGELGYAFRDLPFKTLDLFSEFSADAAVLDLFAVNEEPPVFAGRINPNAASARILDSVISGAFQNEATPTLTKVSAAESSSVAAAIRATLDATPMVNPAELATSLGSAIQGAIGVDPDANRSSASRANKTYFEAPMRALSAVVATRTWNLFIDVVAQTGTVTRGAGSLDDFRVDGERRYWMHVAIDRYTGRVVDQSLEPVYD